LFIKFPNGVDDDVEVETEDRGGDCVILVLISVW